MTNEQKLKAGWFSEVPSDLAEGMLSLGSWIQFERGDIVYGLGDVKTDLLGIASGSLSMQIAMGEHEHRLAHICGPGFWLGDVEFVSGAPRMMEVEATEDLLLFRIRRDDFMELARSFPDAWRWIALLAVQHIATAVGAADDLMLRAPEKRVAATLLRLFGYRFAHPTSKPLETIYLNQLELAVAVNLSRAATGKVLREMAREGEIITDYGSITICNAEALAARLV